jgi:DNA-binding transcriptional ArsR family regulator
MSTRATVVARESRLDDVFSALGDATRRRILAKLAEGPATVTELAAPFEMTLPAVSKHLRVLERAGLMRRERDGWYHRCHLETDPLEGALAFLTKYRPFWEGTLDALERHVTEGAETKCRR